MTNGEFSAWAMKAWEKEVLKNMPAAKLVRELKASQRESKKALAHARRSLVASQASSQRKFHQRQLDLERESRERRESSDRKFDELRWQLAMGPK